ncbi:hypothetical protein ACQ4PT_055938 [Festuca glaucescens]
MPTSSALPLASSVAAPAAFRVATPPIPAPATAVEHPPLLSGAEVAAVVAATHVGTKRWRAGQHVVQPQPATAPAPPVAPLVAPPIAPDAPPDATPPTTKGHRKTAALGPKKPAGANPTIKKTTSRKKAAPAPTIADPPPVLHEVLDVMPTTPTSFMGLLQDAEVDLGAPTLEPFGFGDELEEEEEEEEEEDEEEVTEIDASTVACSAVRARDSLRV